MKRILHLVGGMDRAGLETMLMNLYRVLNREKVQFDFMCLTNKTNKKYDFEDEINELGGRIYRIVSKNPIKKILKLKRFLSEHPEYTVVHSHTLFNSGFNLLVANYAGVPIRIAHSHSSSEVAKDSVLRMIYKNISRLLMNKYATSFIACSKNAGSFLFGKDIRPTIINNGIDIDKYNQTGNSFRNYLNDIYKLSSDCIKIIQVGRLEKVKNHTFSLKIAQRLKEQNINFQMFIIGQGSLKENIEEQIKKLHLQDFVVLTGIRKDVPNLMAGADIMILPSFHEGFPVVLVEAQAIGIPSIISDTISSEVDLGVELVKFKSIDEDIDSWIEDILLFRRSRNEEMTKILKLKGFDVKDNIRSLMAIYEA